MQVVSKWILRSSFLPDEPLADEEVPVAGTAAADCPRPSSPFISAAALLATLSSRRLLRASIRSAADGLAALQSPWLRFLATLSACAPNDHCKCALRASSRIWAPLFCSRTRGPGPTAGPRIVRPPSELGPAPALAEVAGHAPGEGSRPRIAPCAACRRSPSPSCAPRQSPCATARGCGCVVWCGRYSQLGGSIQMGVPSSSRAGGTLR